jgi:hypothetical protein
MEREWKRRSVAVHYPGDYAHVRRCAECQGKTEGDWYKPAADQRKDGKR